MKDKLDNIIEKHSINFELMIEKINHYLEMRRSDENIDIDKSWKINLECVNSFAKIAEMCFSYGNFKDEWEYSQFYQNFDGPELIIKSKKTSCGYRIGLAQNGIYLSTDLRFNDNLRFMGDDFWSSLLELSTHKGFNFEEYEHISKERKNKFPELFTANKSMIYRILRKYIFDQTDADFREGSSSVGDFKIVFPFETDFVEQIKGFCTSFQIMYQLNYKLWKISDLKNKKN